MDIGNVRTINKVDMDKLNTINDNEIPYGLPIREYPRKGMKIAMELFKKNSKNTKNITAQEMIDKKKIDEAAKEYASKRDIFLKCGCHIGFKAGINWFLDNLWHDASEEPKNKSAILFECKDLICKWASLDEVDADDWGQTVKELGITRWFYIDDLLKGGSNG